MALTSTSLHHLSSFISIKHSWLHSLAAYSPGIPSSTTNNTLWQNRADDFSDNQMFLWCFHICSLYNQADRFEPLRARLSRGSEKHLEQFNDSIGCVINTQVCMCGTIPVFKRMMAEYEWWRVTSECQGTVLYICYRVNVFNGTAEN